jgi:hypothetical protein
LDYFLISNTLQDNIIEADIFPAVRSDHSGIGIEVKNSRQQQRGRGYWEFNVKLLTNEQYTEEIVKNLENWKVEVKHGSCSFW